MQHKPDPLLNRIVTLYKKRPRIAFLMSGQGSNVEVVLKQKERYPNLQFITICTDKKNSRANYLSQMYQLEYYCQEGPTKTIELRNDYFNQLTNYLHSQQIDTLIYAGFMKITPAFFLEIFPGINIHPADLTIINSKGKPTYTGIGTIQAALENGDDYIASTVHVVDSDVDCGTPIMVSKHLPINKCDVDIPSLHEQLKIQCEHLLLPRVLELMSQGLLFPTCLPYRWE